VKSTIKLESINKRTGEILYIVTRITWK